MDVKLSPFKPKGRLLAQPSKSDAHRKIICSSFSSGAGIIDNLVLSDDITATIDALRSSGCKISVDDSKTFTNRKVAYIDGYTDGIIAKRIIDCGESGSTLRFLSMIFAIIGGLTTLNGKGRLPERPMNHALDFFDNLGIKYTIPKNGNYLPMTIKSYSNNLDFTIDCSVSSQYLSGILMGMAAKKIAGSVSVVGKFESKGYVEMTCGVLKQFGVQIKGNNPFLLNASEGMVNNKIDVEGDWSNASYFLIMNKMGGDIDIIGLMPDSLQPDKAISLLLEKMSKCENMDIDISEYPDLMPSLAVFASTLPVITTLRGKKLRYKESDRIKAVCAGLKSIGAEVKELDDGLTINGGKPIEGGIVESFNDHRIAMAFSSLSCVSKGDIIIRDAGCINKSYPDFYKDMESVGGKIV